MLRLAVCPPNCWREGKGQFGRERTKLPGEGRAGTETLILVVHSAVFPTSKNCLEKIDEMGAVGLPDLLYRQR